MAAGYNRVPNPDRPPDAERFRGAVMHSRRATATPSRSRASACWSSAPATPARRSRSISPSAARSPTLAVRTPVNVVPRDFLGLPTQLTSIRMRRLPLKLRDAIGRLVSRLAFGNLARFGLARPAFGPLSSIKLRRRIPLIDVGTIAAIKRGDIAVKPAVTRFTESGAAFADDSAAEFDAIVLATGYRPALAEILDVPGVLDDRRVTRATGGAAARSRTSSSSATRSRRRGCCGEIGIDAEAAAAAIAAAGALTRT